MAECIKYWYRVFYRYNVERKELAIRRDKTWNEKSFEVGGAERNLLKANELKSIYLIFKILFEFFFCFLSMCLKYL